MKKEDITTMAVGMMHLNGMTYPALGLLRDPDLLNSRKEVDLKEGRSGWNEEVTEKKNPEN